MRKFVVCHILQILLYHFLRSIAISTPLTFEFNVGTGTHYVTNPDRRKIKFILWEATMIKWLFLLLNVCLTTSEVTYVYFIWIFILLTLRSTLTYFYSNNYSF